MMISFFTFPTYWFSFYLKDNHDVILKHCTFALSRNDFDEFTITKLKLDLKLLQGAKVTYTIVDKFHEIKLDQYTILRGDEKKIFCIWESYFKDFIDKYPDILIMTPTNEIANQVI
jgi:hypothetical protein